jgi:hypothetical protein
MNKMIKLTLILVLTNVFLAEDNLSFLEAQQQEEAFSEIARFIEMMDGSLTTTQRLTLGILEGLGIQNVQASDLSNCPILDSNFIERMKSIAVDVRAFINDGKSVFKVYSIAQNIIALPGSQPLKRDCIRDLPEHIRNNLEDFFRRVSETRKRDIASRLVTRSVDIFGAVSKIINSAEPGKSRDLGNGIGTLLNKLFN